MLTYIEHFICADDFLSAYMMNSIMPQSRDDYDVHFRDFLRAQRSKLYYLNSHKQKTEEAGL